MIYTHKPKTPLSSHVLDTNQCVENAGGNRFNLVLIASKRVRELSRGYKKLTATDNSHAVTALREIEAGLIGPEYLKK
jgi:DNA-directed RNA polymerase omega subunit